MTVFEPQPAVSKLKHRRFLSSLWAVLAIKRLGGANG
jgi:hypothetical protein